MADNVQNAGQQVGEAALQGAEGAAEASAGTLAQDVENIGTAAAAPAKELNDDLIAALKTVVGSTFDGVETSLKSVGGNLPFPLSLVVPSLFAAAHQLRVQLESELDAEIDAGDKLVLTQAAAAVALLKADLDKLVNFKA